MITTNYAVVGMIWTAIISSSSLMTVLIYVSKTKHKLAKTLLTITILVYSTYWLRTEAHTSNSELVQEVIVVDDIDKLTNLYVSSGDDKYSLYNDIDNICINDTEYRNQIVTRTSDYITKAKLLWVDVIIEDTRVNVDLYIDNNVNEMIEENEYTLYSKN